MNRSVPISPMSPMTSPLSSLSSMSPLSSLSSLSSMVGQPNQSLVGGPKNVPGMGAGKFFLPQMLFHCVCVCEWFEKNILNIFRLLSNRYDESSTRSKHATAISASNAATTATPANTTIANSSDDTDRHVATGKHTQLLNQIRS